MFVWQSTAEGETDVAVRRFSSNGTQLGDDFVIANEFPDGYPRVSTAASGGFVVAWHNGGSIDGLDGSTTGVFAQRFSANGTTAGPVFQVNTNSENTRDGIDVATRS